MSDVKVVIHTEFIELNQLLKLAGVVDSGGAGKALVAAGGVRVNNKEELRKTAKIRPGQRVQAGEVRIRVVAAKSVADAPADRNEAGEGE